jgi:cardiolipin synthase
VYVGSSNLDPRSLRLNFEVMVRVQDPALAREARGVFDADIAHSQTLSAAAWARGRSWRTRVLQRLAHFLLARVDVDWTLSRLRRLRVRWRRGRG